MPGVENVVTDVKKKTVVVTHKAEVEDVLAAVLGWGKKSGRSVSLPERI